MKRRVFIRVSNKTTKMDIGIKRKYQALDKGYKYNNTYFPTITLQLNLDIPDEYFEKAQKELDLKINSLNINSDIVIREDMEEAGK